MNQLGDGNKIDAEHWLERYGNYLFRYAYSRINRQTEAEDLVQETFIAALRSMENFKQQSSEKTWLTGILKFKIIDYFRKKSRESSVRDSGTFTDNMEDLFDRKGNWKKSPLEWNLSAHELFEKKEFRLVMDDCVAGLKGKTANVFVLRELDGESTENICETLDISQSNCWVILHRARQLIRRCLEINWFVKEA